MTAALNGLWTLSLIGTLAVGLQAVQGDKPSPQPAAPAIEPPIDETARLIEENLRLKRQLVDAAAQAQERAQAARPQAKDEPATLVTYGPGGRFIPASQIVRRPYKSYEPPKPRPKFHYREPTCTPSRAQIAWARMLPNHDGLASRGLSDEEIVRYFAPSEIKALEGDEVPEHLRPDTRPAVVFINERCADGTCRTGYCEASRRNLGCKDGRCPATRQ